MLTSELRVEPCGTADMMATWTVQYAGRWANHVAGPECATAVVKNSMNGKQLSQVIDDFIYIQLKKKSLLPYHCHCCYHFSY